MWTEVIDSRRYSKGSLIVSNVHVNILTLSPAAPYAPSCPTALGLIGPRKKEKKTGFDDIS
jgi:hypothetical protein